MEDRRKTKAQLIKELESVRQAIVLRSDSGLAQTLYASLVAAATDAIILVDNRQNILEFNASAADVFGYHSGDVIGKPLAMLMPARYRENHQQHVQSFGKTRTASRTMRSLGRMLSGLRSNGEEFPMEVSISHLRFQNKDFYAAIVRDVTGRVGLENLIIRQFESLNTLHLITLDLLNRRDIKDLLQFIVNQAVALLEVAYCEILLPDGDELVAKAFTRNRPFVLGDRFARDAGLLSWQAFDSGKPAIVDDYSNWPHRNRVYDGEVFHAAAAIPIMIADKCIGVLGLTREKPDYRFNEEHLLTATRLAASIALAMENSRLYHEVSRLATTDELTGAHNRRSIIEIGTHEYQRCIRFRHPLCVVMLDVDHFKMVNDTWGHVTGDMVLRAVSGEIVRQIRKTDVVGRYTDSDVESENLLGRFGGEEFIILFPETPLPGALSVAERIRTAIENMKLTTDGGSVFHITASLGVAQLGLQTDSFLDMIKNADQALYQAKEQGRNQICTFSSTL